MGFYPTDLHLHTALSPCGGEEMTPPNIVAAALAEGLQLIAVTDHNSAGNVAAVMAAAAGSGLTIIPGMEVQSREDVHLVCLFAELEAVLDWQEEVYRRLPDARNREEYFGPQLLLDERGREKGREQRLLLAGIDLSCEEVARAVAARGGLCLPAHVDRPSFSLLANLGFVPPEMEVIALELGLYEPAVARAKLPQLADWPLVAASDAHYLGDIGNKVTIYDLEAPDLASLKKALQENKFKVVFKRR
ncbi:MAG: PHP domain-containing protein [Clostridia bacterium]|nr:PHP domain-containing protein [Clostridia bacterium]